MRILKIKNSIYSSISAIPAANAERKLVRQIDTGVRRLHNMAQTHQDMYYKSTIASGHYSKNPLKRLASFMKSWNYNRKKIASQNK